jgi:hypothetical protein
MPALEPPHRKAYAHPRLNKILRVEIRRVLSVHVILRVENKATHGHPHLRDAPLLL